MYVVHLMLQPVIVGLQSSCHENHMNKDLIKTRGMYMLTFAGWKLCNKIEQEVMQLQTHLRQVHLMILLTSYLHKNLILLKKQ